ncbi:MAG: hypothetical protein MHPDNHAH_01271 [Anaerolineales bacterium]|nr:hypothetical protein [Anaerolineales bacterium]WKZ46656.1 MAG: oligosaccharide flippase family protein [Anaerolineales bacterium]
MNLDRDVNKLSSAFNRLGISKKYSTGILWNIASFGIIAISGLLLNFAVAFYYDVAILGVFNQVYALYIFLSQLAVGGVHLSVLKVIAHAQHDTRRVVELFSSGFLITLFTSLFISIATFLLRDFFGKALDSEGVSIGIVCVAPGLLFFSLNKVILALLNGLSRMKAYAVFQALRFIFMLLFLIILVNLDVSGDRIPAIFSLAEFLLFIFLFVSCYKYIDVYKFISCKNDLYTHAVFGLKAAGGNLLLDINTRIDVIVLGLFASDRMVGIYSFAALVVEGFSQLPVVLRANVNPLITQNFYYQSRETFVKLLRRIRNLSYAVLIPIGVALTLAYPVIFMVNPDPDIAASWMPLAILMLGTLLGIGYMPLLMIFNQIGRPESQTILIALIFFTNLILNLILVPPFGILGSAVGTGLTFAIQILYIRGFSFKTIGIRV